MIRKQIVGLCLLLIIGFQAFAQNGISVSNQIPKFMSLNPDNYPETPQKITLQYSQWINYTTLIDYYNEPAYSITVQVVSTYLPKGFVMKAKAGPYKGLSKGNMGMTTGEKTISKEAGILIDNITTCYTGSGNGQGHKTVLFFSVPKRFEADTNTYKVNVVYTLMQ